jgi:spermidine/putrescine transport system permease protein
MSLSDSRPIDSLQKVVQSDARFSTLLIAPLAVFITAIFLIPLLYLVRISLYARAPQAAFIDGTWSLESYRYIFASQLIRDIATFTLWFAFVTTLITIALSVIYAYAIWRAPPKLQTVLLTTAILALLGSLVVKIYALLLILSPNGMLNLVLQWVGVISEPLMLVNNEFGTILGQVYIVLPYGILIIYGILTSMDDTLVHAARDLGATRRRAFLEVVLPHIVPGILVTSIISFTWGVGGYTAPVIMGSEQERTFAIQVENLMLQQFDWPVASGVSILVLICVVALLITMVYILSKTQGEMYGF